MTITSGRAIVRHLGYWGDYRKGAAMNAIPPARGRRVKFTPQAIEKIKELVAEGLSRDEIANRLGVTVGSLQVTCSRLELFSRLSPSATSSLIFSIACGVNLTR